ncbi:MAG: 2-oxoacid:ferredoxin oxidoreductase subunit gamma [Actinobacteria bacterium]|nr:2-oxoacid:ferredoxin oxidoreductase subunit gamma [Actinomycetota bacterium]
MPKTHNIILAGFGGQGVLFAGKLIATAGLIEDRELSWLPSYGPEMRGGTANCSVCLSDEPIGSPLVLEPDALLVMNQPSFDKFIETVAKGGVVIADSTMIPKITMPFDVSVYTIPATQLSEEHDLKGLANIIMLGKLFKEIDFCSAETLDAALVKCIPAKKQHLLEPNRKALALGMDY